jgi:hypothetical protein
VTTGAGQKLAKKSGKLTVPMNTGAVVRIKITGKKPGTSRVTFIAESGAKASIKIVVTSEKLNPNKIAITVPGNAHIMPIDGRRLLNLDFKITPAKATGAVAEWTSSAPLIAPVDTNGVVTLTTAIRDYPEPIAITARVGKLKAVYRLKQADWN